jgi:hypothetical protein
VTLAHELAHIRLHDPFAASTDARPTSERVATGKCRGDQEVEAESVAYLVATVHGIDTADYTFVYLAGWASSKADDIVDVTQRLGTRVVRTAHDILDRISATEAADGEPSLRSARRMPIDRASPLRQPPVMGAAPTPRRSTVGSSVERCL